MLLALAVAGCAVTAGAHRATVLDVREVAGAWIGWLITTRDSYAATLEITSDGTFALSASRTRAAGRVMIEGGVLRFEGTGGWRGTMSVYADDGHRLLKMVRDDKLFPGRFTPKLRS